MTSESVGQGEMRQEETGERVWNTFINVAGLGVAEFSRLGNGVRGLRKETERNMFIVPDWRYVRKEHWSKLYAKETKKSSAS